MAINNNIATTEKMKNLVIKGPPNKRSHIDKGIGEYFFEQSERYKDKIFQIDGESEDIETYYVVRQRCTRVAIYLLKIGIQPRDIIMICCRNNRHNVIPALAASFTGAYFSSIDPKQTFSEAKHIISIIKPKIFFIEENSLPLVEKCLKELNLNPKIIVIGNSEKYVKMCDLEIETPAEKSFKPIEQKGSDIAGILLSSGTTGTPKGIYISNSYVLNSFVTMIQHNNVKPGMVFHSSTLYWISGWMLTGLIIATGTGKVVAPYITGEKILQLVEKYKITYLIAASTFTYEITNLSEEVINKYNTSSLWSILVGGSTVDPQQILRLRRLLPYSKIGIGYGSTEANLAIFCDFSYEEFYHSKVSSTGTVWPGVAVKVVDLGTGNLLGPNQEGEIRIKSPYSMSGYHNLEKSDIYDEEGFLKMGDIGYYDDDHWFYITDRIGEMFKYQVNHLSPSILEITILSHSAVAEAVAFGVPHPVDRNHPGACIVLKKETNATVNEILEFVNSKVSEPYQLRAGLMIVDFIPKTVTGKVQRRNIRDLFIKANKEQ